jgi:hypothetical protein
MKERTSFFEKKRNKKTSANLAPGRCNIPAQKEQKFFGSFFQKRTAFT